MKMRLVVNGKHPRFIYVLTPLRSVVLTLPLAYQMASFDIGSPNDVSSEQFAGWLAKVMDNTSLSLALGIGAELGLFSVMAELEGPATSDFIAEKAGLVERLVLGIVFLDIIGLPTVLGGGIAGNNHDKIILTLMASHLNSFCFNSIEF